MNHTSQLLKTWLLVTLLAIIGTSSFASCSSDDSTPSNRPTIDKIEQRGKILIGTTGDYRPLSFCEPETGEYWGFGIEMAKAIADKMGVSVEFVKTSWPTLTADVQAEPQMFDLAIGGITITDTRRETMLMSDGYLANGKTILCRASEAERYQSLADLDKPEVRVMVNPGGLNEKFANENLTHAERRNPLPRGRGTGRRDDHRDHRSPLLCPDRPPTRSTPPERALHSWRDRRADAQGARRPAAIGE